MPRCTRRFSALFARVRLTNLRRRAVTSFRRRSVPRGRPTGGLRSLVPGAAEAASARFLQNIRSAWRATA